MRIWMIQKKKVAFSWVSIKYHPETGVFVSVLPYWMSLLLGRALWHKLSWIFISHMCRVHDAIYKQWSWGKTEEHACKSFPHWPDFHTKPFISEYKVIFFIHKYNNTSETSTSVNQMFFLFSFFFTRKQCKGRDKVSFSPLIFPINQTLQMYVPKSSTHLNLVHNYWKTTIKLKPYSKGSIHKSWQPYMEA